MKLSIDLGFGHIKYAFFDENNDLVVRKIPSILTVMEDAEKGTLTMDGKEHCHIGKNLSFGKQKELVEFKELQKYAPLFYAHILNEIGVSPSDIEAVAFCLAPVFAEHFDEFKKSISKFTINGEDFKLKNVSIHKQGECAIKAIDEQEEGGLPKDGEVLIVDIGFKTIDYACIVDGIPNENFISKNSFSDVGVIVVAKEIKKIIDSRADNEISIKRAMQAVTSGKCKISGKDVDLTDDIKLASEKYSESLISRIKKEYANTVEQAELVCFIGGGSYFINTSKYANFKKYENGEFFNAYGALLSI